MSGNRDRAAGVGIVVVKIGSAILAPGGRLDVSRLEAMAAEIAGLRAAGVGVCVVSSGAVACGLGPLGWGAMPARIADRQVAAAVGQPVLMRAWSAALEARGLHAAQVLLTADDADRRERFINARRTLETLIERGVVPIVNENDSVAYDEIKLGDNDRLSALAAHLAGADLLIMLSQARGLCEGGPGGRVIPVVEDLAEARRHATDERSATGVGGMATKLDAAGAALALGIEVVLASGEEVAGGDGSVLRRVCAGEAIGTRFVRAGGVDRVAARKHWIGHGTTVRGAVIVDEGAKRALVERGASLLPKGIARVECKARGFGVGETVEIRVEGGAAFARGIVSYSSAEIDRIRGRAASEIGGVLGYTTCDEVVHRDNLYVFERGRP